MWNAKYDSLAMTLKASNCIFHEIKLKADGGTSDGYHTFDELYYHRMVLFSVICNKFKARAWKSLHHHDDTMYPNYFIVGVNTPQGQFTYHYHLDHWDMFKVTELLRAPEWDGHQSEDITRLLSLLGEDL